MPRKWNSKSRSVTLFMQIMSRRIALNSTRKIKKNVNTATLRGDRKTCVAVNELSSIYGYVLPVNPGCGVT
jgi:hypothetical protein